MVLFKSCETHLSKVPAALSRDRLFSLIPSNSSHEKLKENALFDICARELGMGLCFLRNIQIKRPTKRGVIRAGI